LVLTSLKLLTSERRPEFVTWRSEGFKVAPPSNSAICMIETLFQCLPLCFRGHGFQSCNFRQRATHRQVEFKMAATIPVRLGNAHVLGCMQDSNPILRAKFIFLRCSNNVWQVWKMSNVSVSDKSKTTYKNQKCIRNISACMCDSHEIPR